MALAIVVTLGVTARGAGFDPVAVIKTRQQALKTLGAASKSIHRQLQSQSTDLAEVRAAAAGIEQAANEFSRWFPAGSGPEAGVSTGASPEIWRNPQSFAQLSEKFVQQAGRLRQAASLNDRAALSDAFRSVAETCKACHEQFRTDRG